MVIRQKRRRRDKKYATYTDKELGALSRAMGVMFIIDLVASLVSAGAALWSLDRNQCISIFSGLVTFIAVVAAVWLLLVIMKNIINPLILMAFRHLTDRKPWRWLSWSFSCKSALAYWYKHASYAKVMAIISIDLVINILMIICPCVLVGVDQSYFYCMVIFGCLSVVGLLFWLSALLSIPEGTAEIDVIVVTYYNN